MANEIQFTFLQDVKNGNYQAGRINLPNVYYDQVNLGAFEGTIKVGITETTLSSGLNDPSFLYLRNLDETNFVQFGFATGNYVIRLRPLDFALFRTETAVATVYMLANTAPCDVQYRWLEF